MTEYDRIIKGIAQIARGRIKRTVAARPQGVVFSQGCYDALVRDLPDMIADATTRSVVLETAIAKIVTLELQVSDLQDRLAKLEGHATTPDLPIKASDPGSSVIRLREIAAA